MMYNFRHQPRHGLDGWAGARVYFKAHGSDKDQRKVRGYRIHPSAKEFSIRALDTFRHVSGSCPFFPFFSLLATLALSVTPELRVTQSHPSITLSAG